MWLLCSPPPSIQGSWHLPPSWMNHENALGAGYTKALTTLRRGNFSFGSKIRMVSAVVFNKLTKLSSFFCPEHMRYFHFLMTVCYVQLPESLSPEKNSKGFFSCWSEQGGSNHGTKCWDICSVLRGCVASCIV